MNVGTAKLDADVDARLAEMSRMNEEADVTQVEVARINRQPDWYPAAIGPGAMLVIFVMAELFL